MRDVDRQKKAGSEFVRPKGSLFPELNAYPTEPAPVKRAIVDEDDYEYTPPRPNTDQTAQAVTTLVKQRRKLNIKKPGTKTIVISLCLVAAAGLGTAVFFILQPAKKPNSTLSSVHDPATFTRPGVTIFVPKDLPTGYTYNNDQKMLKTNVYYATVTGPKNQKFYITQQPIPASFDFTTFNKKFLTPDTFSASAGTATVGVVGPSVLASVRSAKNTWIIINTDSSTPVANMEAVVRSLQELKYH
jgi:hypothetical protein